MLMPSNHATYQSPSKLNLFLEVLGCRDDGFHELETVMVRTSFCEELTIAPTECQSTTLDVTGKQRLKDGVPTDESNLILRAVRAFQDAASMTTEFNIELNKQIPSESGLAGGSGNAATTLRVLNELFDYPLTDQKLHQIAASLGSDINFFVADCAAAVCTGRGERVVPVDVSAQNAFHFVVARPSMGNSTPAVFRQLTQQEKLSHPTQNSVDVVDALESGSASKLQTALFNRLTDAACQRNPQMARLLQDMEEACDRPAAMSGSGSTCFVCCDSQADAQAALKKVQNLNPEFTMALKLK